MATNIEVTDEVYRMLAEIAAVSGVSVPQLLSSYVDTFGALSSANVALVNRLAVVLSKPISEEWLKVLNTVIRSCELGD